MDGTPLAKAEDLATWFPGVSPEDPKLVEALAEASNRFRGAVRHNVSREHRIVQLDGEGARYLRLPSMNVETASVVGIDTLTSDPLPLNASRDGTIAPANGGVFPDGLGNVTVEYDAGYEENEIPPDIQAVVVDSARVLFSLKRGVQWLAVGGMSMSVNATDATGVTQAWSDCVDLYRIRRGDRA